jgi:hypothetical protein
VHYKQTSHAVALLAAVSTAAALALLLLLHPLSPTPTPLHPAFLHLLFVTRTLASSALIAPSITSVARVTAPYALPLSLATMLLPQVTLYVMHHRCAHCSPVANILFHSLWPAVACAACELLLCCGMVLAERQAAVKAHVRLLSYEFHSRAQQVCAVAAALGHAGDVYADGSCCRNCNGERTRSKKKSGRCHPALHALTPTLSHASARR